jgi:cation transport protein ChaC
MVAAIAFVADPKHMQYAGKLSREELIRFVRQGHGLSGTNSDYVRNTQAHLKELAIRDATLEWLTRAFSSGVDAGPPENAA